VGRSHERRRAPGIPSRRTGVQQQSEVALALIDPERLAGVRARRVDVDIADSRADGVAKFEAAFDPDGTRMRPLSRN